MTNKLEGNFNIRLKNSSNTHQTFAIRMTKEMENLILENSKKIKITRVSEDEFKLVINNFESNFRIHSQECTDYYHVNNYENSFQQVGVVTNKLMSLKSSITDSQSKRIKEQTVKSNLKTSETVLVNEKKRKINPIQRKGEENSKKQKTVSVEKPSKVSKPSKPTTYEPILSKELKSELQEILIEKDFPNEITSYEQYKNSKIVFREIHPVYQKVNEKIELGSKTVKELGVKLDQEKDQLFKKMISSQIEKSFADIKEAKSLYLDLHSKLTDLKGKIEKYVKSYEKKK
eukprot:gene92-4341_t